MDSGPPDRHANRLADRADRGPMTQAAVVVTTASMCTPVSAVRRDADDEHRGEQPPTAVKGRLPPPRSAVSARLGSLGPASALSPSTSPVSRTTAPPPPPPPGTP